ncbi:MAG: ABC transporter permease [Rhizobiaceae bacterium]
MRRLAFHWQAVAALILAIAGWYAGPWSVAEQQALADPTATLDYPFMVTRSFIVWALVLAALVSFARIGTFARALVAFAGAHIAAWYLIDGIGGFEGTARWPFYLSLAAAWLLAWLCVTQLSALKPRAGVVSLLLRLVIPFIFGAWILILWEAIVRGAGVPFVLLPPPSMIGARFASSLPVLWADWQQTFLLSALIGFGIGCLLGFGVAILADRYRFLRRGLLPIGNMVAALPIIGIAPIMVMWFGFDWHSKAAVVAVMTFFPMLVNTLAGLEAAGRMERDLMRTYASSHWHELIKLRLPAASPFIFNALKINTTLAMIGAIVAEFFGTPTVGMGFRISTEVGKMNIDMVWAEIAVAALVGSVFYGFIALIERAATFWHPSVRSGRTN